MTRACDFFHIYTSRHFYVGPCNHFCPLTAHEYLFMAIHLDMPSPYLAAMIDIHHRIDINAEISSRTKVDATSTPASLRITTIRIEIIVETDMFAATVSAM